MGEAGGGHGGLFGGHGEVQHVDEHEADAVVEAGEHGVVEVAAGQAADVDFEQRHQGDEHAAAGCGAQHAPVFAAVAGDVVFAVAAGVLADAAGEHFHVAAPQWQDAPLRHHGHGDFVGQEQGAQQALGAGARGKQRHEPFHAGEGLLKALQQVRHGHGGAGAGAGAFALQAFDEGAALRQHHV